MLAFGMAREALIRLRLSSVTWPSICACCGEPSETTVPARRGLFAKGKHRAPVCGPCAKHATDWSDGTQRAGQLGVAGYFASVVAYTVTHSPFVGIAFLGMLPVVSIFQRRAQHEAELGCSLRCTSAGPPVVDLRGGALGFTSEAYAVEVALANRATLLAAPDIVRARLEPARAIVVERERTTD
jgi:hypothetical protein